MSTCTMNDVCEHNENIQNTPNCTPEKGKFYGMSIISQ